MQTASSITLALLITICAETFVAYLYGIHEKREIACIALVNTITNPTLNVVLIILSRYRSTILILFLELAVVLIEWLLLKYSIKHSNSKLLILSVLMNLCSYFGGSIFFSLFSEYLL